MVPFDEKVKNLVILDLCPLIFNTQKKASACGFGLSKLVPHIMLRKTSLIWCWIIFFSCSQQKEILFSALPSYLQCFGILYVLYLSLTLQYGFTDKEASFIEEILAISNEKINEKLGSVLKKEQQELDPVLKKKLTSSALKANEDIKAGRVYSREEAEAKIKRRMGI